MARAPRTRAATSESGAQEQATHAAVAVAATAPGAAPAEVTGQQGQPAEGGQPQGGGEQGAALAQSLETNEAGKLVVAADQVVDLEPVAGGELAGKSASLAIQDEFDAAGTPWEGLQRAAYAVVLERLRQVSAEGLTLENDDTYTSGQLARAASCYLIAPAGLPTVRARINWPFHPATFKPGLTRADLVKAGALIIAEIERLDRAEEQA